MMESWIKQSGYPIMTRNYETGRIYWADNIAKTIQFSWKRESGRIR